MYARIVITLIALTAAAPVLADGCFLAPFQHEIYETDQLAYLAHDGSTEELHILPGFQTNTERFAWIIPTPSLPELAESNVQLFYDCAALSYPVWRDRDDIWGCTEEEILTANAGGRDEVTVIEREIVGAYDTMILSAENADALADSLEAWGFLHADNREAVEPVLADYVAGGWYFTTLRIEGDESTGTWYGGVDPVSLTFATDEPVYPLRISAVSAVYDSYVVIYTAAAARLTYPGATTTYANRLTASELQAVRERYPALGAELSEGVMLTRLQNRFSPEEMDEDLFLTPDEDESEFRRINYSGLPLTTGIVFLSIAVAKFGPWRRRREGP